MDKRREPTILGALLEKVDRDQENSKERIISNLLEAIRERQKKITPEKFSDRLVKIR